MANENQGNPVDNNSGETSVKFSVGVQFHPTDYRLITTYLNGRHEGLHKLLPDNKIRDIDDLFSSSPSKLFEKYGFKKHETWYFYSKFEKSKYKRKWLDTGDGEGYWIWGSDVRKIMDPNGDTKEHGQRIIGQRRNLSFYSRGRGEAANAVTTSWSMRIYSSRSNNIQAPASTSSDPIQELDDVVVCMIYNREYQRQYNLGSLRRPEDGPSFIANA